MSGFAGIVYLEPTTASDDAARPAIDGMARAIAFRGPDGARQHCVPGAAFAFSLLKTGPAPQEAEQPVSLDRENWLIGDVRCDGRAELFARLEARGGQVSSDASSERLLLHALAAFGAAGLDEIAGDLSFAVWNQSERKLTAFRDLTGARPFFYAGSGAVLAFSNTLQALLTLPWVSRDLDEQFLGDFLLGSPYHDQTRTVYKHIHRLPAGHLLEFSKSGLATRRVANMPVEEPLHLRPAEYIEEFRRLLAQAVRDQLPEANTSILLSGGLDSTTLAACAASLRKEAATGSNLRLFAYTIDYQPLYDDGETALASRFAAQLGIPCEIIHSGNVLPFTSSDDWDKPLLPEPSLDPYVLLSNSYFRQIANLSRLAFSGGGGDEVLRLQAMPYLRYLRKTQGLTAPVMTVARFVFAQRRLPALGAGIRSGLRSLFGHKPPAPSFPPWLNENFSRRLDLPARWRTLQAPTAQEHPANPVAYASVNSGMVSSILETYDAFWTGCPLEVRSPFMDRRLTCFLLRVPAVPWLMEKHLLRESQRGTLPEEIRCRPKVPLQGDPVLLHRAAGSWNPAPEAPPTECVQSLVCWDQLLTLLKSDRDESLHLHLRPVALDCWLKAVEKHECFQ